VDNEKRVPRSSFAWAGFFSRLQKLRPQEKAARARFGVLAARGS